MGKHIKTILITFIICASVMTLLCLSNLCLAKKTNNMILPSIYQSQPYKDYYFYSNIFITHTISDTYICIKDTVNYGFLDPDNHETGYIHEDEYTVTAFNVLNMLIITIIITSIIFIFKLKKQKELLTKNST